MTTSAETASGADGAATRRPVYTLEYGTVRRALEYAALYVVVANCTAMAVALLAESSLGSTADVLATGVAAFLWLLLVVTVALEVRRQTRANPLNAGDGDAVAVLRAVRIDARRAAVAAGVAGVGAAAIAVGWEPFVWATNAPGESVPLLADRLLGPGRLTLDTALPFLLDSRLGRSLFFFAGVALLPYGVDRLVVGTVREVQYRLAVRRSVG